MAFGKPGRPADDHLLRQREIYEAVSPLIVEMGVQRLSMRRAAQAACLSVGGLYHHFPTKHELVLHGIQAEAITRYCQDFHARFGYLADSDPVAFLDAYLDFLTSCIGFVRPSVNAALGVRVEALDSILAPTLTAANEEFTARFGAAFPDADAEAVQHAGRAIHRAIVSALFDRTVTTHEFRRDVHALINGYLVREQATPAAI